MAFSYKQEIEKIKKLNRQKQREVDNLLADRRRKVVVSVASANHDHSNTTVPCGAEGTVVHDASMLYINEKPYKQEIERKQAESPKGSGY